MPRATPWKVVLKEPDDELRSALLRLQRVLLRHPVATQAGYAALVAEGRRAADTPEGAAWLARLEGSELVDRVRLIWESVSLGAFEDDPDVLLPDAVIELLTTLVAREGIEGLLSTLHAGERR